MRDKKKKIGIIFGGRSSEHEISIMSAAGVIEAIDREIYDPVPFYIDRAGAWYSVEASLEGLNELTDPRIENLASDSRRVAFNDFDAMTDFAFPLLHGPYGEDGTIQGLFEMLGKPYAGCGVAAAAISMDKVFMKDAWAKSNLPIGDFTYTTRYACEWCAIGGITEEAERIEREIPYPIFIKPANMGSSIGVSKVSSHAEIETAIAAALKYDKRVVAERMIDGRELEIGVLGNREIYTSVVGEILTDGVYYDYDRKYRGGTKLVIPADIPEDVRLEIEELAEKAYRALDGEGFARIDMFYDEDRGSVFLNEMNAIPGFTKYSMFPLMWREKGVGFTELIGRIIELGYERYFFKNSR